MTNQEIVQALRCTSTPGGLSEDCTDLGQIMLAKLTPGREEAK